MIDFTNSIEEFNTFRGSEKKKTLIYNDKRYLVKFPDPVRQKDKNISYINNAYSEYIGSNVFKICNFDVQNTILGIYNYKGKEKVVCACEDFTDLYTNLFEFSNLALSFNPDKKIETEISDILEVLNESKNLIQIDDIQDKFWDMFIIDALIGNTDRHNGNWGFLLDMKTGKFSFSPIYDCGSCLNPLLDDNDIKKLTDKEIKNLAINSHSCLKDNDNKINYFPYIESKKNNNVNDALIRVFPNIDINKIIDFISNIECMSNERKNFYINIIKIRYDVLNKVYRDI